MSSINGKGSEILAVQVQQIEGINSELASLAVAVVLRRRLFPREQLTDYIARVYRSPRSQQANHCFCASADFRGRTDRANRDRPKAVGVAGDQFFYIVPASVILFPVFAALHTMQAKAVMPWANDASEFALAISMLFFNGMLIFAWLVAIVLMLTRKNTFRYLYSILVLLSCVAAFTSIILFKLSMRARVPVTQTELKYEGMMGVMTLFALVVGVPYMLFSHRARNTFSRSMD